MSNPSNAAIADQAQERGRHLLDELQAETVEVAKLGGQALRSLTWLWPLRGLIYTLFRELKLPLSQ